MATGPTPPTPQAIKSSHATIGCLTISAIFILTFASCALILDHRDRAEREKRQEAINKELEQVQEYVNQLAEYLQGIQYTDEQLDTQNEYFATCFGNEARKGNMTNDQIGEIARKIQDRSDHVTWVSERMTVAINCSDAGYPIDLAEIFSIK